MATVADSATARPTHIRYFVVALTVMMSFLLYLDRFCLSLAVGYIKQDLTLTGQQTDLLLGAFFLSYALGQVPAGWLGDRYGARIMLTLYILLWSLFTGLMGLAASFVTVMVLRLGCGVAQAGAYPTGAGVVRNWMPFAARGRASAMVAVGGRIGGAVAPLLTALLIVAFVPVGTVSSLLQPGDVIDEQGFREVLARPPANAQGKVAEVLRGPVGVDVEGPALVPALNEKILAWPGLYDEVDLKQFKLEDEAKRLAAVPGTELPREKLERRNRLLLEAAFPEYIRKVYGAGWRPAMVVYGLAGVVVAGAFWLGFRNYPHDHPACNAAEVSIIESDQSGAVSAPSAIEPKPIVADRPNRRVGGIPLTLLLRSGNQWSSSASQFFTNLGWTFLVTLFPGYLQTVHKVSLVEIGFLSFLPIFVGMFGMFAGGWVTDGLTRLTGQRWGRRLPVVLTRFAAALAFISCLLLNTPWAVTIALCVVAVCTDLGTPALWAFCQDTGGRHVGSVLGWGNMWGNIGAALTPYVMGSIARAAGWDWVFISGMAVFVLSGLVAFRLDATEPLIAGETA